MSQFEAEITFLISSFSHLGMKEFLRPVPGVVGLGDTDRPWLWIAGLKDRKPIEDGTEVGVVHVALGAAGEFLFSICSSFLGQVEREKQTDDFIFLETISIYPTVYLKRVRLH